jgi:hypothetical protein
MDKKRQKTSTFSSLLYCHPEELVLWYTQELLFPKLQLFTNVITFVVNILFSPNTKKTKDRFPESGGHFCRVPSSNIGVSHHHPV